MSTDTNFPLSRITTRYDEIEDRVLVSGAAPGDVVYNAWLTRRLMDRLVASLAQILAPSNQDGLAEVLNDFAQHRAEATLEPVPPVIADQDVDSLDALITSIDIQNHRDFVRLLLRCEGAGAATVSLTHRELRQWLSIIRQAYVKSGWPAQAWPAWLIAPKASQG